MKLASNRSGLIRLPGVWLRGGGGRKLTVYSEEEELADETYCIRLCP